MLDFLGDSNSRSHTLINYYLFQKLKVNLIIYHYFNNTNLFLCSIKDNNMDFLFGRDTNNNQLIVSFSFSSLLFSFLYFCFHGCHYFFGCSQSQAPPIKVFVCLYPWGDTKLAHIVQSKAGPFVNDIGPAKISLSFVLLTRFYVDFQTNYETTPQKILTSIFFKHTVDES